MSEDIIKEALREYVGDGDGEDERVLEEYNQWLLAKCRRPEWHDGPCNPVSPPEDQEWPLSQQLKEAMDEPLDKDILEGK